MSDRDLNLHAKLLKIANLAGALQRTKAAYGYKYVPEEDIQAKEKELYDLKHELIAAQIKLENTEKSVKEMQLEINESAKKIVRLETELKEHKR